MSFGTPSMSETALSLTRRRRKKRNNGFRRKDEERSTRKALGRARGFFVQ
jgi:hypothetical protein